MHHTKAYAAGVLLLACVGLAGCQKAQSQTIAAPPPPVVYFTLPVTKEVTDFEEFTGRTDAVKSVDIRARATGYLLSANFTEGAIVHEKDALFLIDPRPAEADLKKAEANVIQNQVHLKRLDSDYRRATVLRARNAITQEDYDKYEGDRAEAEANLHVAEASRDISQLNLEYTEVRAPLTGRISRRMIDPGNLVTADTTLLTSIVALDPIFAYFDVDERTFLRIQRLVEEKKIKSALGNKDPVLLGLADEKGFPHKGFIDFIDNKNDAGTGTRRYRGNFENANQQLSPGLFARIRLPIGVPHTAVVLNEKALQSDQGRRYVYVIDDKSQAIKTFVTVGQAYEMGTRVIEKGLSNQDRVVISGLQRIRPGAVVDAKPEQEEKAGVVGTESHDGQIASNW